MKIASSWSGGKDSCFALMQVLNKQNQLSCIVNMMNENGKVSRSHGLSLNILNQQANSLKVPLITRSTSWSNYENNFIESLSIVKQNYGVEGIVFGDIDLQPHRDWEEMVCNKVNLSAILPLWKQDRKTLVLQMISYGIEAIIVSCNTKMGFDFLGRKIDYSLIEELEVLDIDVCGENGEYHTLVTNCPLFSNEIFLPTFTKISYNDYCFIVWDE